MLKLEIRTPEQEIMAAAALALRRHDAKTDAEVVERVLGDYRAGGLLSRDSKIRLKLSRKDRWTSCI